MTGERSTFILKSEKFKGMLTTGTGVDGTGTGGGKVRFFKRVEPGISADRLTIGARGAAFFVEGKVKDLQSRIDKIIEEERESSSGVVGDFAVAVQHGMWRCGLEVLKDYPELEDYKSSERGGRGLRGLVSWNRIAHEVSRTDKTIKMWVDLVIRVGKTKSDWEGSSPS
jgi:hypothetical protein